MALQRIRLPGALKRFKLKRPEPCPLSFHSHSESGSDSDLELSRSPTEVPADVGKGSLAVYISGDNDNDDDDDDKLQRYVIPVNYLKHMVFKILLKSSEEEFGFRHSGGIRIPCEALLFEHVLWLLSKNDPDVESLEMEELLSFYCFDYKGCERHHF